MESIVQDGPPNPDRNERDTVPWTATLRYAGRTETFPYYNDPGDSVPTIGQVIEQLICLIHIEPDAYDPDPDNRMPSKRLLRHYRRLRNQLQRLVGSTLLSQMIDWNYDMLMLSPDSY